MNMALVEPGIYRAKATGGDVGLTDNGKEQVAVQFELLDLPGTFITAYMYFTDKTTERTLESLRICGWDTDDVCDLHGVDANEVSIVVEHDEYNGKVNAKVKWINRLGGGGPTIKNAMPAANKAAFAQRMKAAAIVSRAKAPPASATPAPVKRPALPANAGDALEDDLSDLPFARNVTSETEERWNRSRVGIATP